MTSFGSDRLIVRHNKLVIFIELEAVVFAPGEREMKPPAGNGVEKDLPLLL